MFLKPEVLLKLAEEIFKETVSSHYFPQNKPMKPGNWLFVFLYLYYTLSCSIKYNLEFFNYISEQSTEPVILLPVFKLRMSTCVPHHNAVELPQSNKQAGRTSTGPRGSGGPWTTDPDHPGLRWHRATTLRQKTNAAKWFKTNKHRKKTTPNYNMSMSKVEDPILFWIQHDTGWWVHKAARRSFYCVLCYYYYMMPSSSSSSSSPPTTQEPLLQSVWQLQLLQSYRTNTETEYCWTFRIKALKVLPCIFIEKYFRINSFADFWPWCLCCVQPTTVLSGKYGSTLFIPEYFHFISIHTSA